MTLCSPVINRGLLQSTLICAPGVGQDIPVRSVSMLFRWTTGRAVYPPAASLLADDRAFCCAAIHKQAAVLSEETLLEREVALNGTAQHVKGVKGARSAGGSKAGSVPGSALDSTYNLGVAAGLISETQAVSRAQSAAVPRSNSSFWNEKAARGRCKSPYAFCNPLACSTESCCDQLVLPCMSS